MLLIMQDQYPYQSSTTDITMETADNHHPDWACHVDFLAIPGWKISDMAGELNSQP